MHTIPLKFDRAPELLIIAACLLVIALTPLAYRKANVDRHALLLARVQAFGAAVAAKLPAEQYAFFTPEAQRRQPWEAYQAAPLMFLEMNATQVYHAEGWSNATVVMSCAIRAGGIEFKGLHRMYAWKYLHDNWYIDIQLGSKDAFKALFAQ